MKKSSLQKVQVEDLDSVENTEPEKVPVFLREKTFNSELSFLLNKISSNEKSPASADETRGNINADIQLKNTALHEIEKLIYELKHFEEAGADSAGFNPFNLDVDVYDDIDDLNDYITEGMRQAGAEKFLLLRFNLSDNSFRTDINLINESMTTDVFFGLKDEIIENLKTNTTGIIITPDSIKNDSFLYKKFRNAFNNPDEITSFYLVRINNICRKSCHDTFYEKKLADYSFLSPLLIVSLDKTKEYDPDSIFNTLLRFASIPLGIYMMNFAIKTAISGFNYRDTLLMIDLYTKISENMKMNTGIIRLSDYSLKENVFIYTFMLSKIRKKLKKNSLFIRINIDQAVFVCSDEELDEITNVTDRINEVNETITVETFDYRDYSHENHFTRLFL